MECYYFKLSGFTLTNESLFFFLILPSLAARISCSRTVRNVTFNANGTFQIFQSPSYPRTYLSDVNCTYLFKAQEGHRIELRFSAFRLEGASPICDNDYIVVRDGPSEKSPLINKFCGPVEPRPIISSKNSLYLYFVSNEKFVFDGFNGTYRVISEGKTGVGIIALLRNVNQRVGRGGGGGGGYSRESLMEEKGSQT